MKYRLWVLLFLFLLNSCTVYKRQHFSGFTLQSRGIKRSKLHQESPKTGVLESSAGFHWDTDPNTFSETSSNDSTSNLQFIISEKKSLNSNSVIGSQTENKEEVCDEIHLKNRTVVKGKIVSMEGDSVRYTDCGKNDGLTFAFNKKVISKVVHASGEVQTFYYSNEKKNYSPRTKIEPFGIFSFFIGLFSISIFYLFLSGVFTMNSVILGSVSVLLIMILLALLGLIFGVISFNRIHVENGIYRRLGFDLAGIIFNSIPIIALLLGLLLILFLFIFFSF